MYSIHNRDDLEKLKNLQETKSLLHKERLKEKLGKQDFHYYMEEVFEPVTENQKQNISKQQEFSEKQIQALRDSTQTTTQAIQDQNRAIRESSNTMQKSIKEGIQEYDEITNRNNQLLTILVNSNQVDSSIVKTVSNLLNDKNKCQFSLEPIMGNPNLFTINPSNPQQVLIKNTTLTFFGSGNIDDLNDPDLQYFTTNTKLDREINNKNIIHSFLNDMKYDTSYEDKKSMRYYFIKDLHNQYYQLGSGLPSYARKLSRSNSQSYAGSHTNQYVFLPSDPDELVDQLKLLYFEKLEGNDNPQLNEQIIAIVDKLLEYECITTNQHQKMRSNLISSII